MTRPRPQATPCQVEFEGGVACPNTATTFFVLAKEIENSAPGKKRLGWQGGGFEVCADCAKKLKIAREATIEEKRNQPR